MNLNTGSRDRKGEITNYYQGLTGWMNDYLIVPNQTYVLAQVQCNSVYAGNIFGHSLILH